MSIVGQLVVLKDLSPLTQIKQNIMLNYQEIHGKMKLYAITKLFWLKPMQILS